MNTGATLEENPTNSLLTQDSGLQFKTRVHQILTGIQKKAIKREYDPPGMLILLGYDPQNSLHTSFYSSSDHSQNSFRYPVPTPEYVMTPRAASRIEETRKYDGAILIDPTGYVIDSGIYLRRIDPIEVLDLMEVNNHRDLSERFGFVDKVHARHLAAICASYLMRNTTTFTLSEDTGLLRIFEDGKIIYSQHPKEPVSMELIVDSIIP
jgi:DNA integrity scanning protein DisA with diadenylate cyclase activity